MITLYEIEREEYTMEILTQIPTHFKYFFLLTKLNNELFNQNHTCILKQSISRESKPRIRTNILMKQLSKNKT